MPIQRHRSNEMQTENIAPSSQFEEIIALKDQLKLQEEEISRLNKEVSIWKDEKANIENELKRARLFHTQETRNLLDKIDSLEAENSELVDALKKQKCENLDLRHESQTLSSKLFTAEENLKVAKLDKEKVLQSEKDCQKLLREQLILGELHQRLKEQLESLQNSHSFNKNNSEFEREQMRHIEKQNEDLRIKLDVKIAEIKALKVREKELEQINSERDLINAELKQILEQTKSSYQEHLNVKSERIEALTKTNIRLNQNIVRLQQQANISVMDRIDNGEEARNDTSSEARTNDSILANGMHLSSEQNVSDWNQLSDLSVGDSYDNSSHT